MATKKSEIGGSASTGSGWNPNWETGEHGLPKERYIDPDFAKLEAEKLWPHVWQWACREEQIPRAGDYTVYEIIDQSILVIRQADDTIKAYHNVCPHRATALAVGTGRFSTGEITCPFHGWRWNLEGENTFVLDRDEFKDGCLSDEDVHLREVQVETWCGWVWINMDKDAAPLDDHIAPIRGLLDPMRIDEMRVWWWKQLVVPCNWKIAQEAFHEEYHVPQTHPQLFNREEDFELYTCRSNYDTFDNGHGTFYVNAEKAQPTSHSQHMGPKFTSSQEKQIEELIYGMEMMSDDLTLGLSSDEIAIAKGMRHREIPKGVTMMEEYGRLVGEMYALQGRNLGTYGDIAVTDVLVFPNWTTLPSPGSILFYRARPYGVDPDMCIFEMGYLRKYGEGETPRPPKIEVCTDGGDPDQFPLIPRQDFANVPRMQRGLHSHGLKQTLLAGHQEGIIRNMHQELDRYLKG